jgi:hypothetical protein
VTIGEEIATEWFGFTGNEDLPKEVVVLLGEDLVKRTGPQALAILIDKRLAEAIERGE